MKKILSAMTESLVVVICTIAFALTAVGILASVLGRGPAGNRDFVDYWVSAPANPHDAQSDLAARTTASTLRGRAISWQFLDSPVPSLRLGSYLACRFFILASICGPRQFGLWGTFSLRTEAA